MRIVLMIAAAVLMLAGVAEAQPVERSTPVCTTASLVAGTCVPVKKGNRAVVTDALTSLDCTSGGGSSTNLCEYTGSRWDIVPNSGAIGYYQMAAMVDSVILCGENAENGVTYFGPSTGAFGGNGADLSLGSAACDALDNTTETSADAPLFTARSFKILGFYCTTAATLGASESIVFSLHTDEAAFSPDLTCTIGTGETECAETDASNVSSIPSSVGPASTIAMSVTQTSNNADDNGWCRVFISIF